MAAPTPPRARSVPFVPQSFRHLAQASGFVSGWPLRARSPGQEEENPSNPKGSDQHPRPFPKGSLRLRRTARLKTRLEARLGGPRTRPTRSGLAGRAGTKPFFLFVSFFTGPPCKAAARTNQSARAGPRPGQVRATTGPRNPEAWRGWLDRVGPGRGCASAPGARSKRPRARVRPPSLWSVPKLVPSPSQSGARAPLRGARTFPINAPPFPC